jgi:hypothetical protein
MRSIMAVIRSQSLVEWKRWEHVLRLGGCDRSIPKSHIA